MSTLGFLGFQICANFTVKVNPRFFPLPLGGAFGNIPNRCDFAKREPTEKLKIHDLRELRFSFGQVIQDIAEPSEIPVVDCIFGFGTQRSDMKLTAAFLSAAIPSMVDNHPAHRADGVAHESSAVGKRSRIIRSDLQISLM